LATEEYVNEKTKPHYVTAGQKADTILGKRATAEGIKTTASGDYSHAEGQATLAIGVGSHAEGKETQANG
jgi:hypothetical protein